MGESNLKNEILDNLFEKLRSREIYRIKEKDLISNYDWKDHPKIIKSLIRKVVNDGYVESLTASMTMLRIDSLGEDVLDYDSWTDYIKNKSNESNIYNDFSNSNIGQLNQDSDLSNSRFKNEQNNYLTPKKNAFNIIISFISKVWWKILIPLILIAIGFMVNEKIIDISWIYN